MERDVEAEGSHKLTVATALAVLIDHLMGAYCLLMRLLARTVRS